MQINIAAENCSEWEAGAVVMLHSKVLLISGRPVLLTSALNIHL